MAEIKDITKDNFSTDVLRSDGLTLVYYYAPWCKPCQNTEEILETAADEVDGQIKTVRVNTDTEQEIVTQQKVQTIPHFQVFKKGKVINALNGVPSKLELMGMLGNLISEHMPAEQNPAPPTNPSPAPQEDVLKEE